MIVSNIKMQTKCTIFYQLFKNDILILFRTLATDLLILSKIFDYGNGIFQRVYKNNLLYYRFLLYLQVFCAIVFASIGKESCGESRTEFPAAIPKYSKLFQ